MIKFLLLLFLFGCEEEFYFVPNPSHYSYVSFERALILNRQGVEIHRYFPSFPHHKIIHYPYSNVCYYKGSVVPCVGDVFFGSSFDCYLYRGGY